MVLLKCTQCSVFDRIHVKPRKLINSSQDEVKKIRKVKIFKFQGVLLYIKKHIHYSLQVLKIVGTIIFSCSVLLFTLQVKNWAGLGPKK